jgi:hypothetical protein
VKPDASPTARALLALELVQGRPVVTADRLADKLGSRSGPPAGTSASSARPASRSSPSVGPTAATASAAACGLRPTFSPPADLDPVAMLEEHLAVGWEYDVEVVIDAPVDTVARCLPRALGRLGPLGAGPAAWSAAPATRCGTPSSSRRAMELRLAVEGRTPAY